MRKDKSYAIQKNEIRQFKLIIKEVGTPKTKHEDFDAKRFFLYTHVRTCTNISMHYLETRAKEPIVILPVQQLKAGTFQM